MDGKEGTLQQTLRRKMDTTRTTTQPHHATAQVVIWAVHPSANQARTPPRASTTLRVEQLTTASAQLANRAVPTRTAMEAHNVWTAASARSLLREATFQCWQR